jgi:riboflavin synthase
MFTGLIKDLGTVEEVQHRGRSSRLRVLAHALDLSDLELGESIAINGACLTAVSHSGQAFAVDVSPESLDKTTLGRLKHGDRVHLERALRMADRLGGHLVLGHVDGVGRLERRRPEGNAWHLTFAAGPEVTAYLVPKGCVAVDGVSLTVNRCDGAGFDVTIVPHTADKTLLLELREGAPVNLEADVLGKYVAGLLGGLGGGARPPGTDERLRGLVAQAGLVGPGWGEGTER